MKKVGISHNVSIGNRLLKCNLLTTETDCNFVFNGGGVEEERSTEDARAQVNFTRTLNEMLSFGEERLGNISFDTPLIHLDKGTCGWMAGWMSVNMASIWPSVNLQSIPILPSGITAFLELSSLDGGYAEHAAVVPTRDNGQIIIIVILVVMVASRPYCWILKFDYTRNLHRLWAI